MTKQRQLIFNIIKNSREHLTAEDIFLQAKKVCPTIAFGTVYRNLGLMVESKEIGKVERPNEPTRYDKSSIPHCHAKCIACGEVVDVDVMGLYQFIDKQIENLDSYELSINYTCKDCIETQQK